MQSLNQNNNRQNGMTLLQLVISMSLFLVCLSAISGIMKSTSIAYYDVSAAVNSESELRRVLDRLTTELRIAHPDSLILSSAVDSREYEFSTIIGWDGERSTASAVQTVVFNAGVITFNGTVIAREIDDFVCNKVGQLFTIEMTVTRGDLQRTLSTSVRI